MNQKSIFRNLLAALLVLPTCVFAGESEKSVTQNTHQSPALFVENKGQIVGQDGKSRNDIDFKLNGKGINIFIGDGQIHYQWTKSQPSADGLSELLDKMGSKTNLKKHDVDIYRLDVVLEGANRNALVTTEEKQGYYESYYSESPEGITAHSYKKITYKDIYPGIDWVLYVEGGMQEEKSGIKYDFVVHAGADPRMIKLKYDGATELALQDGALKAVTPYGDITEAKPYTYVQGTKTEVKSSFALNDNALSFDIEPTDKTIVIDPYLNWGSYFGSTAADWGSSVAVNNIGDVYICGYTIGQFNLATFGSHQYTYGGFTQEGFITKFSNAGIRLWASYYGGNGFDQVNDIAVDGSGNVFITGTTTSTNAISTFGSHQATHGGSAAGYSAYDVFLVKFNANGVRQWGTYYGDSLEDIGHAVACDRSGNVYVGGRTDSRRYIATNGAFKTTYSGGFLAKFSTGGVRQWGTYFGDTGHAYISAIACDSKGNIYCGGSTSSYTNISTSGSHQPANGGGSTGALSYEDGFLAKFNTSGQRIWSTYYGGDDFDNVVTVACDERGGVYIGGESKSTTTNAIATTGAYQTTLATGVCGKSFDGFIAKFNENGVRQWGSYYGGIYTDRITDISTIPNGNIYVSGWRFHACPPGPPPPYYPPVSYIIKLNSAGFRTWLEDSVSDQASARIAYGDGKLSFVSTASDTLRDTTRGFFKTLSGSADAYIQHYTVDTSAFITLPFADTMYCYGDTLKIPYDVTNKFNTGNTLTLQLSDLSGSFTNATTIATKSTDTGGILSYVIPTTLQTGNGYRVRIIGSSPADTSYDNFADIRISEYPKVYPIAIFPVCANGSLDLNDTITTNPSSTTYLWTGPGSFSINQKQYQRPNVQSSDAGYYVLTADNYGCSVKDSVLVSITPKPNKPTFTSNSPLCLGDSLKLSATSSTPGVTEYSLGLYQAGNLVWFNQGVPGDTLIVPSTLNDTGSYIALAIKDGCPSDPETTKVVISPYVIPTVQVSATPGATVGPWVSITFGVSGTSNTGTSPSYQWMKNGVDIPGATGSTYITQTSSDLQTGDTICVRMTSNAMCAVPATVKSCIGFTMDLGIGSKQAAANAAKLYPNPTDGNFYIETKSAGMFYVNNIHGQIVAEYSLEKGKTNLELPLYLTNGIYVGKFVTDGVTSSVQRIVLSR